MRISRIPVLPIPMNKTEADLSLIEGLIRKYKGEKGNMIPLLQGAQEIYGFLPKAVMEKISCETGIELSKIYGVATFYAQFRMNPVGKIIVKVCHGTACHVQNAREVTEAIEEVLNVKDGGTTEDRLFTLESVACLGCCSLAPVMMIGDQAYGKLSGTEAIKVIKTIRSAENN